MWKEEINICMSLCFARYQTLTMHWKRVSHGFKSRIDLTIFQALFSLFNTVEITFKFISDTDTILRICTWLQITDILVKSVVNIHFVFASYEEKMHFQWLIPCLIR